MGSGAGPKSPTEEGVANANATDSRCDRGGGPSEPSQFDRDELEAIGRRLDETRSERSIPAPNPAQAPIEPEVWTLHVRYARTRDSQVQARLTEIYTGYATSLARRLHREGEPMSDLVQVAMEALLLAIERFDPDRSLPFPAFATPTIIGSLKRHYRDLGWSMRVPRRIHEIAAPVRDTADRLTVELGRSPLVAEVAKATGLSETQVLEAQEAAYARSMTSLDAPMGEDGSRFDTIGSFDVDLGRVENRLALSQALDTLSDRERLLVQLYFVEELTQSAIGEQLGVSQMQVSRWLAGTIRRLRDRMTA